ncbi:MAG: V4R domain-containing protein [Candidatus Freyarchaeota archaeon]
MKLLGTGIPALDFLIGGGFEENAQILLLNETGSMGEILPLQIMDFRLKKGDRGFILDLDLPPSRIREWLSQLNVKFEEYEKNRMCFIVDGFTNLYGKKPSQEEFVIDEPRDIIHLNSYLHEIIQFIKKFESNFFCVCYMSNVMLSKGRDIDRIINLIYKTKILLSDCGTSIFVFNRGMIDEKSTSTLKHIFDYVIELRVCEVDRGYQRFLRISKSPSLHYIDDLVPFKLSEKGIVPSTEIMEEFQRLKQHLKMPERGVVELLGARSIITSVDILTQLFESLIKECGYEKASRILYSLGRKGSKKIIDQFMRSYKPINPGEAVPIYARFNTLRGFGLFIGDYDEENRILQTRHINSPVCNRLKHIKKPTGFWFAGVISGLYESLTGTKCTTEEVKCIAKGDEHCEFITKPIDTQRS